MNNALQPFRITLLNIDHIYLDHTWDYTNVISPFSRLYYIKSGNGTVHHHGQSFQLKAGYFYLIPSFSYSRYKCDHKMEQIYVHFLEEVGMGLSVYNLKDFAYEVEANPLHIQMMERLLELNPNRSLTNEQPDRYDNIRSLQHFESKNNITSSQHYLETIGIIKVLLAQFIKEKEMELSSAYKDSTIIDSLQYIGNHLHELLTVQELAARCHLNVDYFSRLFKEMTGSRPIVFIQKKRIERAQLLLTTTNYTLKEIADKVGLSSISYFSRLFTKWTNKSPRAYRKEFWSV